SRPHPAAYVLIDGSASRQIDPKGRERDVAEREDDDDNADPRSPRPGPGSPTGADRQGGVGAGAATEPGSPDPDPPLAGDGLSTSLGARPVPTTAPRIIEAMAGRIVSPEVVGRRAELEILSRALADASAGNARTVLVGGEGGLG